MGEWVTCLQALTPSVVGCVTADNYFALSEPVTPTVSEGVELDSLQGLFQLQNPRLGSPDSYLCFRMNCEHGRNNETKGCCFQQQGIF